MIVLTSLPVYPFRVSFKGAAPLVTPAMKSGWGPLWRISAPESTPSTWHFCTQERLLGRHSPLVCHTSSTSINWKSDCQGSNRVNIAILLCIHLKYQVLERYMFTWTCKDLWLGSELFFASLSESLSESARITSSVIVLLTNTKVTRQLTLNNFQMPSSFFSLYGTLLSVSCLQPKGFREQLYIFLLSGLHS